jgi:hypothetical protein
VRSFTRISKQSSGMAVNEVLGVLGVLRVLRVLGNLGMFR